MNVNDHKIQDMGGLENVYIYIILYSLCNQYHMKSANSVFLLQKSEWLKSYYNSLINNNLITTKKMLQNNVICEWIIAYKEPLYQKDSF